MTIIRMMQKKQVDTCGKEGKIVIELVEKAVSGDVDAFLELMEANSLAMYKVARGILKDDNDVADAIQDTILKLSLIHI